MFCHQYLLMNNNNNSRYYISCKETPIRQTIKSNALTQTHCSTWLNSNFWNNWWMIRRKESIEERKTNHWWNPFQWHCKNNTNGTYGWRNALNEFLKPISNLHQSNHLWAWWRFVWKALRWLSGWFQIANVLNERERVWMLIGTRHSDRRFLHAYLLHVNHPKLSLTLFKRREKRMCLVGIWFDQVDLVETSKSNELTHRWEYDAFIRCKHYNIQEIGHLVNTVQIKHWNAIWLHFFVYVLFCFFFEVWSSEQIE